MDKNQIYDLVFKVSSKLDEMNYEIGNVRHIEAELGRVADDALQKEYDNNQQYFLWDNQHKLQILSNYLHQVFIRLNQVSLDTQNLQSMLIKMTKQE